MATTEVKTDVKVTINGKEVLAQKGETILEVARKANIHIPTLCHHSDLCLAGVCRVCICEIEGQRLLQASCSTPVSEGMVINTNTRKVRKARKMIVELLLANHYGECTTCKRSLNCELQALADEYGIDESRFPKIQERRYEVKDDTAIVRDNDKCILCRRCVNVCEEIQGVEAIKPLFRGAETEIGSMYDLDLGEVVCVMCGQCINRCPTGALTEKDATKAVWAAIDDPTKHVIVQTAPAIRATVAELFDVPPGLPITGKLVTALKKMGFDSVLDTDFTADLTIMEEGTELLTRLKKALFFKEEVALPMATSCSPGWVKYIEHYYPDLLENLSTCKSPQQMFGALAKTYYAEKKGINPEDIVTVSVMPCTAKKYEADRPEMYDSGYKDVDYVLTNRELGKMVKESGMNIMELEDSKYDSLMGDSTGAAVIFGVTGGVMEAAIRTAYELVTGREVPFENLNITPARGMEGVKEAELKIEGTVEEWNFLEGAVLKVAIAHGLNNAKILMDKIRAGEADYHFIEIMACPGGCIGGGGQPIPTSDAIRKKRAQAIYDEDMALTLRKSHENPEVKKIYEDYLGKPLGHKSHKLLHTTYTQRGRY